MLIEYDNYKEKLNAIRQGRVREGFKLDLPDIDNWLRFKPSNMNVILGHANVGKTTFILYLMLLYSVRHEIRWLVYSSENEPYSIMRKLVEFLAEKPIQQLNDAEFEKYNQFIFEHFKIIDPIKMYSYKDLLTFCDAVKNQWEYQGLLIDPYNSLVKDPALIQGIGAHEYDYQAMTEMRMFCKRNVVSIWLNTHANTNALRIKHYQGHQYEGHPIPPLASDVEGGGKFVNRADDFFVVHRYIQHPTEWMYTHLHVRKVKEIETGGQPTPIDKPIMLKSIVNNVGFEIDGQSLLKKIVAPF